MDVAIQNNVSSSNVSIVAKVYNLKLEQMGGGKNERFKKNTLSFVQTSIDFLYLLLYLVYIYFKHNMFHIASSYAPFIIPSWRTKWPVVNSSTAKHYSSAER